MTDPPEASRPPDHRTLFAVPLADPRERHKVAGAARRGRPRGRASSSDTRRHAPMALAAGLGALAVIGAYAWRGAGSGPGTGAVALPHRADAITCGSCHLPGEPRGAAAARCADCHGAHPSRRPGHARLSQAGELRCVDCHDVHGSDQGVRITKTGEVLRYAVGVETRVELPALVAPRGRTVPLVPLARCRGCHDPERASDPIGRCVQAGASRAEVTMCFDEHQQWSAVATPRRGGACEAQHANDRFAAWAVAREVATSTAPPERAAAGGGSVLLWMGGLGAALGALGYAGLARWRRRRRAGDEVPVMKRAERVRLPQIDATSCLGCYACVDACPYDVLAVERYVATVVRPEACCGLTLCEQVCPNGSLVITDGEPIGDHPRLDDDLQARDLPGVYLAGDVTGLPLIKNALLQGRRAVESISVGLSRHDLPLDLLIVGAGPAGISAALAAEERRLRYAVVEQGSVAQSIRSFPRGKLVFDQPLDLPVVGKLWLEECSKEELLTKWMRVVREQELVIHEGERFTHLDRIEGGFVARVEPGDGDGEGREIRAARVLVAIGQRGTARQLPIELGPEAQSKVFHHLADAASFAGQRLMVVGLGDVAMETAIALARQPGTQVTISYRGEEFRRGKQRNIQQVRRLVERGGIEVIWRSEVRAVDPEAVTLATPAGPHRLDNDAVFVMIGAEPPRALLERIGVTMGIGLVPAGRGA